MERNQESKAQVSAAVHNITFLLGEVYHDLLVAAIISFGVPPHVGVIVEVKKVGVVVVFYGYVAKHATRLCV